MRKERCIVIPAIKKNAIIPDQLVKKIAGITLLERALNTAKACVGGEDIHTLTDSEEVSLVCERYGTHSHLNASMHFKTLDIVQEMSDFLQGLSNLYMHCIILRPSCPLVTWVDIEDAWKKYKITKADRLITLRKVRQRVWHVNGSRLNPLLLESDTNYGKQNLLLETRALLILDPGNLKTEIPPNQQKIIPYFLNDHGLEIENYQDWWICEHLLQQRHIVFVVAGYPAIGMGHIYRALMLAHEITNHRITFICTDQSDLAVEAIASKDYNVIRQRNKSLAETVLSIKPDLVINDFLDTDPSYMADLTRNNIQTINFEDMGAGAKLADLVINALDESDIENPKIRRGPKYFCLRDEFALAKRNALHKRAKTVLITFGGTDQHDFTLKVLNAIEPICKENNMDIRIVTGPGYAHKEKLESRLRELDNKNITFTSATNIMSKMMENADLALCSAGRTVYELCHMRIPAIVFATHKREETHKFARLRNGFLFGGLMANCSEAKIKKLFLQMLDYKRRSICWIRQDKLNFMDNKKRVMELIQGLLEYSSSNDYAKCKQRSI